MKKTLVKKIITYRCGHAYEVSQVKWTVRDVKEEEAQLCDQCKADEKEITI